MFIFGGTARACQEIGIHLSSDYVNGLVADGLWITLFSESWGWVNSENVRPKDAGNPGIPQAHVPWKANPKVHGTASLFS